jgi:hypothetical protein
MTKENRAKYMQACLALKKLDITPSDFINLDMAMCFETWAEDDPDGEPMTANVAMEIHLDTDYFLDVMNEALKL